MAKNADKLHAAKDAKKDEFYTQLEDINAEMVHYEKQFKGKTGACENAIRLYMDKMRKAVKTIK